MRRRAAILGDLNGAKNNSEMVEILFAFCRSFDYSEAQSGRLHRNAVTRSLPDQSAGQRNESGISGCCVAAAVASGLVRRE